jgi:replication factor C subunit 2/4
MCDSEICEATGYRNLEEIVRDLRDGEGGFQLHYIGIYMLNLMSVDQVEYNDDGLTALIFTSEGDMRQAINNLQSTFSGFGFVSGDNVFKVCDQPHPIIVQAIIRACVKSNIEGAMEKLSELWGQGYSAVDIVVTLFRVVKTFDE